jgi:predicted DNA-binding ribbon-helix-helix protein
MADPPMRRAAAARERSGVVKRSLSIAGHATSISLEEPFWQALRALATRRGVSLAALVATVDQQRGRVNLSSALRVHVLESLQGETGAQPSAGPANTG